MARHKRFHVHFTPTSASWLNMIERFFRDLTENRIRRGVFQDIEQLITAIGDYIDRTTTTQSPSSGPPKPQTSWKKSPALKPQGIKAYPCDALH